MYCLLIAQQVAPPSIPQARRASQGPQLSARETRKHSNAHTCGQHTANTITCGEKPGKSQSPTHAAMALVQSSGMPRPKPTQYHATQAVMSLAGCISQLVPDHERLRKQGVRTNHPQKAERIPPALPVKWRTAIMDRAQAHVQATKINASSQPKQAAGLQQYRWSHNQVGAQPRQAMNACTCVQGMNVACGPAGSQAAPSGVPAAVPGTGAASNWAYEQLALPLEPQHRARQKASPMGSPAQKQPYQVRVPLATGAYVQHSAAS
jgi:hypothetical protein